MSIEKVIMGSDGTYLKINSDGSINTTNRVTGPTLIDTVPFSAFLASQTTYKQYPGIMNRGVKKRSFIIVNTLNQPLASVGFAPYESTTLQGTGISGDGYTSGAITANFSFITNSDVRTALAMNCDSMQFNLAMGATVPTSGSVKIYIIEQL